MITRLTQIILDFKAARGRDPARIGLSPSRFTEFTTDPHFAGKIQSGRKGIFVSIKSLDVFQDTAGRDDRAEVYDSSNQVTFYPLISPVAATASATVPAASPAVSSSTPQPNAPAVNAVPTSPSGQIQNPSIVSLPTGFHVYQPTVTVKAAPTPHNHQWQRYEGVYQVFDFCTICDTKRDAA